MTVARRQLIDADTTPYYHVMTRCVRRAFLCGEDAFTGKDYSHRRQWIEDKLFELVEVFAIDVAAYAIMPNHYHLVLRIDMELVNSWTQEAVFEQYNKLHACAPLVEQYRNNHTFSPAQLIILNEYEAEYRERLGSISWFMKLMNQHIAYKANREDDCKGKFWESRFKSQALLDEAALLTCMAYVDLNPIRANLSETPESSDFTSIQTRLNDAKKVTSQKKNLLCFSTTRTEVNHEDQDSKPVLPLTEASYVELVDWTGRCIRDDKPGAISNHLPPILERLNLTENEWLRHTRHFETRFKRMAGTWESIKRAAKHFGQHWFQGKAKITKPLLN